MVVMMIITMIMMVVVTCTIMLIPIEGDTTKDV